MRHVLSVTLAAVLVIASACVYGQEAQKKNEVKEPPQISAEHGMMMGGGMEGHGMMGKGMMDHGTMKKGSSQMCQMCMMTKSVMSGKEIIATQDGGVVLMMGNKLLKYDKNLKLIGEAEIKIDIEGMQQKMMQMMDNCPMHKKCQGKEPQEEADAQGIVPYHQGQGKTCEFDEPDPHHKAPKD